MSFLRSNENYIIRSNNQTEPSPTNLNNFQDSARNPEISMEGSICCQSVIGCFAEGISLFISLCRKNVNKTSLKLSGGMTVEASILLPLFIFFFLNMGCAIEMIRFHGNMQLALWQVGSEMSLYGYVVDSGEMPEEEQEDSWWKDLAGIAFSSTYIKWRLIDHLGSDYIDQSPLTDGVDSLHLWESEIFGSEDEIDIIVTYSVSPWSRLIGFSPFRMANRYYSHIWNGYRLPLTEEEETKIVYLTEYGKVYHENRNCTYLRLSVRQIDTKELGGVRNRYDRQYEPCTKCAKGVCPVKVYITEEGNCYHYSIDCSSLKRTIYAVPLKEAANYRPCSRCGK